MGRRFTIYFIVLFCSGLLGCQKSEDTDANELSKKILVEGYVFANEPVNIKVASVDPGGLSLSHAARDAQVSLIQGDLEIQLVEHDTIPGHYIQQDPGVLLADTGLVKLIVGYGGNLHSSETVFPSQLTGLEISNSEIYIEPGIIEEVVTTLSWDPIPNAIGYCLFIRNLNESATPISYYTFSSQSPFSRINHSTTVDLKSNDFEYFGSYQIYVTAIGPEFQLMYSGSNNDNLMTAPSNIEDGWGVFTAFNGQSVTVTVQ